MAGAVSGFDATPVLVVAGTDPSAGAGLPADQKVCRDHGCWGLPVVSSVVVQSTAGVERFAPLSPALLEDQWRFIIEDIRPASVKVGMVGGSVLAETLGRLLNELENLPPVVVDPVLTSGHGTPLSQDEMASILLTKVVPHTTLLTPNVNEAEMLTGLQIQTAGEMEWAGKILMEAGARNVLVKGGHIADVDGDVLVSASGTRWFPFPSRIDGLDVHGTGCHMASSLACNLAHGVAAEVAVERSHRYVAGLIESARWSPGAGRQIFGWKTD